MTVQQLATSDSSKINDEVRKNAVQQPAAHDTSKSSVKNPFALSDSIIKMSTQNPATFSSSKSPFDVHDGLNKIHVQRPSTYSYLKGSANGPFPLSDGSKLLRHQPLPPNMRSDYSPPLAVFLLIVLAVWFVCAFLLLKYVKRVRKIELVKPDLEVELGNMRRDVEVANSPSVYKDMEETPENLV
ncbi:hypothetical protein B0J13DRAFT_616023 [Dactylonectria estremocensis]|uniref:Uncharacterized protein n=1 Tax=Dactylonectria estremocensis TaxID=1079267 RepID=A0A9P9FM59_9HYPO|nr:hypothetical protein B0J13DRAFT_616023 [Dactylonectria estremocensis]